MKKYIKPELEFVELRIEERLAKDCTKRDGECNHGQTGGNPFVNKDS